MWSAEADGNRTRLVELLDHVGVEDRGDHQAPRRLPAATVADHGRRLPGVGAAVAQAVVGANPQRVQLVTVRVVLSTLHETLVEMFRHRPSLVADLLSGVLGVELPGYEGVRLEAAECVDLTPAQYWADAVVVLTADGAPVLAVVVEVQLARDPDKWWSWPVYVAMLRARLRCPTLLLVVCVDTGVAGWAATPIKLGNPGALLPPLVLGPELVPVLTATGTADQAPEIAVLSAMAHGGDPDRSGVLDVLVEALSLVETQHAVLYAELVFAALPQAARRHLEALMSTQTYEYVSEYAQKFIARGEARGEARGRAEGQARAVLAVLDARGIEVSDDVRAQIRRCRDLDQLDVLVRRAATVEAADDLFA